MAFKVVLTYGGRNTRDHIIDYLSNNLLSPHIAQNFYKDLLDTLKYLEWSADSYALCEEEQLAKQGIRHIHLKKYKYKVFYHIVGGKEAHVDAILHDEQSLEKWFGLNP